MSCFREIQEEREYELYQKGATKSRETKGRLFDSPKCEFRTEFQRDIDRIIHSKAFRRLSHKTQVFLAPTKDHYRTRLTHTLEVSQIARAISRGLYLNENLSEAIALGHDLGHTPFGHTGEDALNEICSLGFKHYEQSLRVVDILEGECGLNLTFEVRDGILNHTGSNLAKTLEGKVIKYADRIAYINHDIDDSIRAQVFFEDDIPKEFTDVLGKGHKERINNMITNIVLNSSKNSDICMSDEFYKSMMGLRDFMFERVYLSSYVKKEDFKAKDVIFKLFDYFIGNKDKIPKEFLKREEECETQRVVCDYIAGMTDRYAIRLFKDIFVPKSF